MKKLFLITLMVLPLFASAQFDYYMGDTLRKKGEMSEDTPEYFLERAGKRYQLATGLYITGITGTLIGGLVDMDQSTREAVLVGSALAHVVGIASFLAGSGDLRMAGELFYQEREKLSFSPTENGFGLTLNF